MKKAIKSMFIVVVVAAGFALVPVNKAHAFFSECFTGSVRTVCFVDGVDGFACQEAGGEAYPC